MNASPFDDELAGDVGVNKNQIRKELTVPMQTTGRRKRLDWQEKVKCLRV